MYKKEVITSEGGEVAEREDAGFKAEQAVYWLAGIIELLLLIRIILSLLGANRSNVFAQFIYTITYPFVAPFYGLFNSNFQYGIARFEFEAIIAMAVVALLAWVVGWLIAIVRR